MTPGDPGASRAPASPPPFPPRFTEKKSNSTTMSTPRTTPAGRILFVGAGPGNPDLLTLRAREVLAGTSVAYVDPDVMPGVRELVAADLPVPEEVLRAAEEEYERLCTDAKASGSRRKPQRPAPPTAADIREPVGDATEMSRLLVAEARRGHDVVRLNINIFKILNKFSF